MADDHAIVRQGLRLLIDSQPDMQVIGEAADGNAALQMADAILFWFCSETLQPITLYELGAWSMSNKPLFVGVHPAYLRSLDVIVQTRLTRPEIHVVDSLQALAAQVRSAAPAPRG